MSAKLTHRPQQERRGVLEYVVRLLHVIIVKSTYAMNISDFVSNLNALMWGAPMLFLLFGTHLFFTFRLGFIQKFVFKAIRLSVLPREGSEGNVSPFASLATSLAATIGTGNIIGISTAVALGGPGAVFWCWLTGIFGMATSYAECYLGVKYRSKLSDGTYIGGAMCTLGNVLRFRFLSVIFCVCTILVALIMGSSVQSNSIAGAAFSMWKMPANIVGFVVAILSGMVIIGGVKKISGFCRVIVPAMGVFYMVGCFVVLFMNYGFILESLMLIVKSAFLSRSVSGGFVGSTIMSAARFGIARGLFTNEAGLGSAPIAASAAMVKNPVEQGLISMTGTFWDTVVMCAVTGLVIVSNLVKYPVSAVGMSSGELTVAAFNQIPVVGSYILNISLIAFAFATIIGWSFFGERCVCFMLGERWINCYRITYIVMAFVGAVLSLDLIWNVSDVINAFMTVPNLISVLLLSGVVVGETKGYFD